MLDQRADVDAGGRSRYQSERRQHGVASADRGFAVENPREALFGRRLLQRRAGIGHRDEAMSGLAGANRLGNAIEEIVLHRVGLGGAAGFAGDDEQSFGDIDGFFHRADLYGIGRIQHVQFREAGFLRKSFRQHLGAQARSAHAEHDGVGEGLPLHAPRKILVVGDIGVACAVQPAQPLVLILAGPDRSVLPPQPSDFPRCAPFLGAVVDGLSELGAKGKILLVDTAAEHGCALMGDRAIELVGRVGK